MACAWKRLAPMPRSARRLGGRRGTGVTSCMAHPALAARQAQRWEVCRQPLPTPALQVPLQVLDYCADCGADDLNLPPSVYE